MTTAQHETIPAWTCGDRLRKAREHAGLKQQELADAIGIARGSVTNYESDKHPPRKIVLNAWAMATGVNPKWLETGEGESGGSGTPIGAPTSRSTGESVTIGSIVPMAA